MVHALFLETLLACLLYEGIDNNNSLLLIHGAGQRNYSASSAAARDMEMCLKSNCKMYCKSLSRPPASVLGLVGQQPASLIASQLHPQISKPSNLDTRRTRNGIETPASSLSEEFHSFLLLFAS